jgi:NADPH:quinone reductase-like Zn-dependent oxidoreductase
MAWSASAIADLETMPPSKECHRKARRKNCCHHRGNSDIEAATTLSMTAWHRFNCSALQTRPYAYCGRYDVQARGHIMTKNLAGQVALVTGGSRGIGPAIAQRLARDGAPVPITYASAQRWRAMSQCPVDVHDRFGAQEAAEQAWGRQ